MPDKTSVRHPNRLIHEKSPYLLQHAHNAVDWYPWSSEAFEKAKEKDKPIFLSIGYSTCHWCHVMEKESFDNVEVAELLNEAFVCIKVDREERPDLDIIYMKVCQMLTGSGGWPLNIIMTPDKKPFFAATYIPKENRFGSTGLKELIPRIWELWNSHRSEVVNSAKKITTFLEESYLSSSDVTSSDVTLDESTLYKAFKCLCEKFDEHNGGFGDTPKFPTPQNLTFLLRYWNRTANEKALWMVEKTLKSMRLGGIFDHVGYGFHRYSTDSRWLVPHFEKMLYNQAMLIMAYTEAFEATGKEEYERTAREIVTYVLRDMTSPEGGFYSAEDADSEGEEGKFYLWTKEEIRQLLSEDEADFVMKIFNITKEGNSGISIQDKMGENILFLKNSLNEIANTLEVSLGELRERLEKVRDKLFVARERRVRPSKDDKILTDWNGLMIAALSKAARVFNEEEYGNVSRKTVKFIISTMRDSKGRLFHRSRGGAVGIPGFLNDYAFFIWGLIELYETTFEAEYLHKAVALTRDMIEYFWDEKGGFYFTANDIEEVLIRSKEVYDGAYPSGNSVAALNLLNLARLTGKTEFEEKGAQMLQAFSSPILKAPLAHVQMMNALDFAMGPTYEVVIAGDLQADDARNMVQALRRQFIPNTVVLFRFPEGHKESISSLAEFTRNLSAKEGKATAYVCRNYVCNLPTTSIEQMLELLSGKNK